MQDDLHGSTLSVCEGDVFGFFCTLVARGVYSSLEVADSATCNDGEYIGEMEH